MISASFQNKNRAKSNCRRQNHYNYHVTKHPRRDSALSVYVEIEGFWIASGSAAVNQDVCVIHFFPFTLVFNGRQQEYQGIPARRDHLDRHADRRLLAPRLPEELRPPARLRQPEPVQW